MPEWMDERFPRVAHAPGTVGSVSMPRPRKWRMVRALPCVTMFGPLEQMAEGCDPLYMTVDEFETIRLIDHEGLTQESCALMMHVGRSTVQGIYESARGKLAALLVEGRPLCIGGGDYRLGAETEIPLCGYGRSGRRHMGPPCRKRRRQNDRGDSC